MNTRRLDTMTQIWHNRTTNQVNAEFAQQSAETMILKEALRGFLLQERHTHKKPR